MCKGCKQNVGEWIGVAIALVSSSVGGTAAAITRYLVHGADPVALAILRWGIGFACVLPAALLLKVKWPAREDLPAVAFLGLCFFGLFFILYNIAIGFTTAARASLALATLPLSTMVVGALLRVEELTWRKTLGVCIAVLGVVAALAAGPIGSACRRLARRIDHGRRGVLHGLLQCAVAPVDEAIERAWLSHGRYGDGGRGADPGWTLQRQSCSVAGLLGAPMDRRHLSGCRRRRRRLHPLGAGTGAGFTDPCRQYHDCQSDRSRAARNLALVDLDTDDLMAKIRQTSSRNQADIARTHHNNAHRMNPRPIASMSAAEAPRRRDYQNNFLRTPVWRDPCGIQTVIVRSGRARARNSLNALDDPRAFDCGAAAIDGPYTRA